MLLCTEICRCYLSWTCIEQKTGGKNINDVVQKTNRSFISKKFLYDFNQLILLLWIQTAKQRGRNQTTFETLLSAFDSSSFLNCNHELMLTIRQGVLAKKAACKVQAFRFAVRVWRLVEILDGGCSDWL